MSGSSGKPDKEKEEKTAPAEDKKASASSSAGVAAAAAAAAAVTDAKTSPQAAKAPTSPSPKAGTSIASNEIFKRLIQAEDIDEEINDPSHAKLEKIRKRLVEFRRVLLAEKALDNNSDAFTIGTKKYTRKQLATEIDYQYEQYGELRHEIVRDAIATAIQKQRVVEEIAQPPKLRATVFTREPKNTAAWMQKNEPLLKEIELIKMKLKQYNEGIDKFKDDHRNKEDAAELQKINTKLSNLIPRDTPETNKQRLDRTQVVNLLSARNRLLNKENLDEADQKALAANTQKICEIIGCPEDKIKADLASRDTSWKKIAANDRETEKQILAQAHKVEIKDAKGVVIDSVDQQKAKNLNERLKSLEAEKTAGLAKARESEERKPPQNASKSKDTDDKLDYDYTRDKDILATLKGFTPSTDSRPGYLKYIYDKSDPKSPETITVTPNKVNCSSPASDDVLRANAKLFVELMIKNGKSIEDGEYSIFGPDKEKLEKYFKEARAEHLAANVKSVDAKKDTPTSGLATSGAATPEKSNDDKDKEGPPVDSKIGGPAQRLS